jgi:hypothetical protein
VDAGEVVVQEVQADRVHVHSIFLLKAFVSRVKRSMPIRIVRLARST